jgi:uncharacterized protein with von Willebrand factor type A (vWA) domain
MAPTRHAASRLAENIMHFSRALRAAGLPVGPGKAIQAVEAVREVGIGGRSDLYWTLHAVFVQRRDQREIFDQAFHIFWRNPQFLQRMMSMLLPTLRTDGAEDERRREISPRLAEALAGARRGRETGQPRAETEEIEIDATLTFSSREKLQAMDFEKMTSAELAAAKRAIHLLRLPLRETPTRRFRRDARGRRVDMRATLRAGLADPAALPLKFRKARLRRPPLVVLCDISGSMGRYSRLVLHFIHALTNDRDRVHSFLFGTRLTNITRQLRHRDVDLAVEGVAKAVPDWSGGTRIGHCLREFNRRWSRRVLGQGAVMLMITDGLDREGAEGIEEQMERLHKSCRRLIWLNPLLRFDRYEPRAQGSRVMIKHVDDFRPIHNLQSMQDLAVALSAIRP